MKNLKRQKAFVLCFPEYYCEEYEDIENEYSECESCHSKEKTNSLFYAQPKGYIKNMRMIMGLQAWMEQESCCYYQNWWRN